MSTATEPKIDPFLGLPGIFRECVAASSVSYNVSTPWISDGWVYATDGRIAIRTATDLVDADTVETLRALDEKPGPRPRVADIDRVFRLDHEIREESTPIPDSVTEKATCDECGGNGICHGSECDECDGAGWVIPMKPVEVVPGYFLAQRYLELMRRHGARLWVPVKPRTPLQSVFRGLAFEGALMPMTDPEPVPGKDA